MRHLIPLLLALAGLGATAPPLPHPDAPLPRSPATLATRLTGTTRDLDAAVRDWLGTRPGTSARPPEALMLLALDQQRIYRVMRREPKLGEAVIAKLPTRLRSSARDNFAAGRSLLRLAPKKPPSTQPRIKVGPAEPPQKLLGFYRAAERRFGVSRWVLASVNLIESGYNRLRNNSYAGAQGPMQFIPSTWSAYGMGGDIRDPHDAILGAANYLHASGAPGNYRRALYSYNNSALYVDAVLRYARQMKRRPQRFYAYWSWQVFVRSASGYKRLTGPGRTY
jgi:hypothetical protein